MTAARHLTAAELAERLGVSVKTVKNWDRDGLGPDSMKVGNTRRWPETWVEEWERSRRKSATAA